MGYPAIEPSKMVTSSMWMSHPSLTATMPMPAKPFLWEHPVSMPEKSSMCPDDAWQKLWQPGKTVGDIGYAIQSYAEAQGCSVVREFVGHGVGVDFHEAPQIPHYGKPGTGVRLMPGMVFTIEPMINLGKKELLVLDDGWTAVTKDGSLSAQFEQTLLITETGNESLTPYPL